MKPFSYYSEFKNRDEEANKAQEFRDDSLKAVGLFGHPKAEWAYALAWRQAHPWQHREVFEHLDDLANMILEDKLDS